MLKYNSSKVYFFSLGFVSLLCQIVLLRELVSWLGGDELFYALGLGSWLIFVSIGSFLLGRKVKKVSKYFVWELSIFFTCLTPLLLVGFRWGLAQGLAIGQISSLSQSVVILITTLFLPGCLSGLLFYFGCQLWPDSSLAYFHETLGFFAAGLVFTFFLSQTSFPLPKRVDEWSLQFRYPSLKKAVYSQGSQLTAGEEGGQLSVFSAGQLVFSEQQTDFDNIASFVLAQVEANQNKVLLFGDLHLANQISRKFPGPKIFFVQPDKELFKLQQPYLNEDIQAKTEPFKQVLKEQKDFDWVILSPGSPNTLSTSRYYSLENFQLIRQTLKNDGICVIVFDLPTAYQSREALRFGQVIYQTFNQIFDENKLLIVEGRIVLLGSSRNIVFESNKSDGFVNLVLSDSQRIELKEKLSQGSSQLTTKLRPLAYFYHHLFWQTIFSFQLPKLWQHLVWIFPLCLIVGFGVLFSKNSVQADVLVILSSFILMSLEITLLFLFQTQFGNLYTYLGLIMGTLLLGMAIGVGGVKKLKVGIAPNLILFAYLPLGLVLLIDFWQNLIVLWLILGLLIGLVGGMIFGLVNQIWLDKDGEATYIYFADLVGGFLGAVLTAVILLPRFGFEFLMILISILILLPNARNFLRAVRG